MTAIIVPDLIMSLAHDVGLDPRTSQYVLKRFNAEGMNFLTKTLPQVSKAVLRSLELGYFERPEGFAFYSCTLRHFRSCLDCIFDPRTGVVLETVDAGAISRLRQFCEYFYKLALPFTDTQLEKAEREFKAEDKELAAAYIDRAYVDQLRKDFETYYPEISRATVQDVFTHSRPRAGSGTFANHEMYQQAWYMRRETVVACRKELAPYSGFFKPYPSAPVNVPIADDTSDSSDVLFVPKDSRGPRTIVREPYHTLSEQMGFHDWIKGALERGTSFRVNFKDQSINQRLARSSSKDKSLATIDLKSASDRVSARIMQTIFRNSPACRQFLNWRTKSAKLPSGEVIQLAKVAGMGSGLTFPLMSLLITLTICRTIHNATRVPISRLIRQVYVYGDDIIVPTKYTDLAYSGLERVLLKVNREKSFSKSLFRESCGGDYYDGRSVAPVRCRLSHSKPSIRGGLLCCDNTQWVLDFSSHARELVAAGLDSVAEVYYLAVEREHGKLPPISGDSPAIGRWSQDTPVYPVDATGTYRNVRAMFAVPVKRYVGNQRNPYVFLKSRLIGQEAERDWLDTVVGGTTYSEVSVPRKVKYVRRKVSAYRLMG
jgi:hypothetical protein